MKNKFLVLFILLSAFININLFSQNQPKPYDNQEFPQYANDIRRFEIISFGSLPFVMLDSVLIYSTIKWGLNNFHGGFPNPFTAKNSFSTQEMTGIILTSIGISLCIAITDLIINQVKRKKTQQFQQKQILVLPEELNPPVIKEVPEIKEREE